jgi:hypothetical protein
MDDIFGPLTPAERVASATPPKPKPVPIVPVPEDAPAVKGERRMPCAVSH